MAKIRNARHDPSLTPPRPVLHRLVRWLAVAAVGICVGVLVAVWFLTRGGAPDPDRPMPPVTQALPLQIEIPTIPFVDITAQAGLDFKHVSGAAGAKHLPEILGSGAAFVDYDNDGDPDLVLANSTYWAGSGSSDAPPPTAGLYRNDGTGTFENVTRGSGLDFTSYGTGVACGDFDGDGLTDLYLTALGPNTLLRNLGDGRFEDVTEAAGVAGDSRDWSTAAGFFDADKDGDLDLMVANYAVWTPELEEQLRGWHEGPRLYPSPRDLPGQSNRLFRNEGNGTFSDISDESGIRVTLASHAAERGRTLGLAFVDANEDGFLDVFAANDLGRNSLFRNNGDGTFHEEGELFGMAVDGDRRPTASRGVDSSYYRNDRKLGMAVGSHAGERLSLYASQQGYVLFTDDALIEGIGATTLAASTFGVLFLDADLDGRIDLLLANGHTDADAAAADPATTFEQPGLLFWNTGRRAGDAFVLVPPEQTGDLAMPMLARGLSYADIDADGDLDVLITQLDRPPVLLRNEQATGHRWIRVRLAAGGGNPEAIGALVEVVAGDEVQRRRVMPTRSYLSQVEPQVTFGLGLLDTVEEVRVHWPDGSTQVIDQPPVDQVLLITKPQFAPADAT